MVESMLTQLQVLFQRDEETRSRLLKEGRLYGGYEEEMQQVHRENAEALNEIIDKEGWPGISKVGLDGCRIAWRIAQHSICTPRLQRKFLQHLSLAAEAGDAPMKQVAYLTDRIRFNEGRPLVYGTVMDWNENGELGCELENPEMVDALRAQVELPPYEEALEELKKEIASEGGGPPKDIQAFKKAGDEWATSVGWR